MHKPITLDCLKGEDNTLMKLDHNIEKNTMIVRYIPEGGSDLDVGSGRGGDIIKLESRKLTRVVCVEPNEENVKELTRRIEGRGMGDIVTVLRLGAENPRLQELISENDLNVGCISAFFSLTFFFSSEKMLQGLIDNIDFILPDGGIFFGIVLDGKRTRELLDYSNGMYESETFSIKRGKDTDDLFGNTIFTNLVDATSMVKDVKEYLFDFDHFAEKMSERNIHLIYNEYLDGDYIATCPSGHTYSTKEQEGCGTVETDELGEEVPTECSTMPPKKCVPTKGNHFKNMPLSSVVFSALNRAFAFVKGDSDDSRVIELTSKNLPPLRCMDYERIMKVEDIIVPGKIVEIPEDVAKELDIPSKMVVSEERLPSVKSLLEMVADKAAKNTFKKVYAVNLLGPLLEGSLLRMKDNGLIAIKYTRSKVLKDAKISLTELGREVVMAPEDDTESEERLYQRLIKGRGTRVFQTETTSTSISQPVNSTFSAKEVRFLLAFHPDFGVGALVMYRLGSGSYTGGNILKLGGTKNVKIQRKSDEYEAEGTKVLLKETTVDLTRVVFSPEKIEEYTDYLTRMGVDDYSDKDITNLLKSGEQPQEAVQKPTTSSKSSKSPKQTPANALVKNILAVKKKARVKVAMFMKEFEKRRNDIKAKTGKAIHARLRTALEDILEGTDFTVSEDDETIQNGIDDKYVEGSIILNDTEYTLRVSYDPESIGVVLAEKQ